MQLSDLSRNFDLQRCVMRERYRNFNNSRVRDVMLYNIKNIFSAVMIKMARFRPALFVFIMPLYNIIQSYKFDYFWPKYVDHVLMTLTQWCNTVTEQQLHSFNTSTNKHGMCAESIGHP